MGEPDDFRVPHGGYHRTRPTGVWVPTAAIIREVVSSDDETYAKFDFYADHDVDEIIVADPAERSIKCFRRTPTGYVESERSDLLDVEASHLTAVIRWP